mgnify:CR=1 FL=1
MHNVIFLKKNAAMITYINNDIKKEMEISMTISVLLFFCIKIPAINDNITIFNVNDTLDFILTNSIFFFSSFSIFFLLYLAFCLTSQGVPFLVGISSHVLMCI